MDAWQTLEYERPDDSPVLAPTTCVPGPSPAPPPGEGR